MYVGLLKDDEEDKFLANAAIHEATVAYDFPEILLESNWWLPLVWAAKLIRL